MRKTTSAAGATEVDARFYDSTADHEIDRLGLTLGRQLREGELAVPHDIRERLRVARLAAMQAHRDALARQAHDQEQSVAAAQIQHASPSRWWRKALAILPIVGAASVGTIFMQGAVSDDVPAQQVQKDLHLLSSEVPPSAFSDPGFLHYLKNQPQSQASPAAAK